MTIDREMLAAYAQGELDATDGARVEAAVAADPALAADLAAHRALRDRLQAHFAPVADMPVPGHLLDAIRPPPAAYIVDLNAVRYAKAARNRLPAFTPWLTGGAIAASLALGLVIGIRLPNDAPIGKAGGTLVAQGTLDKALTTQLASSDVQPVRILLSLRNGDGQYCRVFDIGSAAGLACRDDGRWTINRLQSSTAAEPSSYRQAGNALADIMAAAQGMAKDGALNPKQEAAARDKDWR